MAQKVQSIWQVFYVGKGVVTVAIEHILILESDETFAVRLVQALKKIDSFTITAVPTVKEACLHLVQRRQDLAFIPVAEGAKIIRSLRAVQPDLRLVLVTPRAEVEIPETYAGKVQGVLIKSLLNVELPLILQQAAERPYLIPPDEQETIAQHPSLDTGLLTNTLHQANLGRLIHTAVFSHDTQLLAHWGELTGSEAAAIAHFVGRGWADFSGISRVQFMHLPVRTGDQLLYTQSINEDDYLLTLAALPETPISELRHQARRLGRKLANVVQGQEPPPTNLLGYNGHDGRISYAIVWQAVAPLPSSLHIPLRRALERLAVENACILTHTRVKADMVHLVVTCPPGRDSAWAAWLFKNGSEQIIQQEYGIMARLWETGYYAVESDDPLAEAELNLFLEKDYLTDE
ncbi:MAG TPA: response regulator transcription factor [Anaerolineae bacterium]|nr:response regulator transcription factor [Anaerolineae bacterium]HIP73858.1 response regulator transcription factor [Anaerolineae bacterium]